MCFRPNNFVIAFKPLFIKFSFHCFFPYQLLTTFIFCFSDGQEIMDKCFELGCQMGSNRKSKDCLKWLKTKKRKIPREEVLGYICGKSPPLRTRPTAATRTPSRLSDRSGNRHLRPSDYGGGTRHDVDELDTFRQAIAMQGVFLFVCNLSQPFCSLFFGY